MKVTRNPGRFTALFAQIKGSDESALVSHNPTHPSLRIYNARPAFIDDTQDGKLKEGKKTPIYTAMDKMAPLIRALWPNGVSPTGALADILV